jgi:CRISPR-associated protein Cst2
MVRQEGDPVPYEHQFYRTTLRGLFSLDLNAVGSFSYRQKAGFRNLDDVRCKLADDKKLEHLEPQKVYQISREERLKRVSVLFDGLAHLEGGAKQTIHYTDVTPPLVVLAVTKGGNHIFGHIIGVDNTKLPTIKTDALAEVMNIFAKEILSPVYIGWTRGYLDEERARFEAWASEHVKEGKILISHPREAYQALIEGLKKNPSWSD